MSDASRHVTPPPKGCELLRENIFEDNPEPDDDDELLKRREPTMLRKGKKLVGPSQDSQKKYTVVFDLDETVVYARDGPLYGRAYLKELLRAIKDRFEVIVWTAGERDYAKAVLEEINEDHIIQHLVYRHRKWFNEEDYTKDLHQLGRNLDYTIMVENTPDCVRANPENGIIVEDFEVLPNEERVQTPQPPPPPPPSSSANPVDGSPGPVEAASQAVAANSGLAVLSDDAGEALPTTVSPLSSSHDEAREVTSSPGAKLKREATDRTLYLLREVLLSLADSGETVPHFLSHCELLSRQTVVGCDGGEIPIYHLGTRRRRRDAGTPKKVVKTNRDKPPRTQVAGAKRPRTTEGEGNDTNEAHDLLTANAPVAEQGETAPPAEVAS